MQHTAAEYANLTLYYYKGVEMPGLVSAVEAIRVRFKLNKSEMADLLGIDSSRYSEFIHDKRELPRKAIVRALALGVPLGTMVKEYAQL